MDDIPADALRESWDSVYQKSIDLAHMIEAHCKATGENFDLMLVVPRGGYYPANIVARELGFSSVAIIHASVGSYEDQSSQQTDFQLGQMPTREQVTGKNILIIDEVCDTGQTLQFLNHYLKEQGAELVRTGVLHHKPTQSQTGFVPDWTVETTDKWIVYPWEPHEVPGLSSVVRRR